jgi:hypothetical protein
MPTMNPHDIGKGMRLVNGFFKEHLEALLNSFRNGRMRVDGLQNIENALSLINKMGDRHDGVRHLGTGGPHPENLYVLMPAALRAGVMLVIALIVNNIPRSRKYPEIWW